MFRRSGRISFVLLAAIASVALVGSLFFLSGESAAAAAGQFMSGLAEQNVDKLVQYSVIHKKSPEEVRKAWEDTLKQTKHYRFYWEITNTRQDQDGTAAVRVEYTKAPDASGAYAEKFELPMLQVNGKWKVDVPEISREMYPFLPR